MEIPMALFLPITSAIVGVTSWNVRLQGRVNEHERLFKEREKQADERHDDFKERLTRIEHKLDVLQYKKG